MKNKLSDLNNHLFSEMERLSDEALTGDELEQEINRSKAITCVAKEIIGNARLSLDATLQLGDLIRVENMPEMLT